MSSPEGILEPIEVEVEEAPTTELAQSVPEETSTQSVSDERAELPIIDAEVVGEENNRPENEMPLVPYGVVEAEIVDDTVKTSDNEPRGQSSSTYDSMPRGNVRIVPLQELREVTPQRVAATPKRETYIEGGKIHIESVFSMSVNIPYFNTAEELLTKSSFGSISPALTPEMIRSPEEDERMSREGQNELLNMELLQFPVGTPVAKVEGLIRKIPGLRPATLFEVLCVGKKDPHILNHHNIACAPSGSELGTNSKFFLCHLENSEVNIIDRNANLKITDPRSCSFVAIKE